MRWLILIVTNVATVLVATFVARLNVAAALFALNDGPAEKAPVPLSWSMALQGAAIPMTVMMFFFLPSIVLLRHDMPRWAFGVTSVPYIFLLVTLPLWWPPLVSFLNWHV